MDKRLSRTLLHKVGFKYLPVTFLVLTFAFTALTEPPALIAEQTSNIQTNISVIPAVRIQGDKSQKSVGMTPNQIKTTYHLPPTGGSGTIAIITVATNQNTETDLSAFSNRFGLPLCTTNNGCLEKHQIGTPDVTDLNWALNTALATQWAHAVAPKAKLLVIESMSPGMDDILDAVSYAKARPDVVAVSMGWGSPEFNTETSYDSYFVSDHIVFFAAASMNRSTILWPGISPQVVGVGGTSLLLSQDRISGESGWEESGGGLSKYFSQPTYQSFAVPMAKGKRATPDVSFNANPASGVAVYLSTADGKSGWYQVGGTSLGATAWAAIRSLGDSQMSLHQLYTDAMANSDAYFHDITNGRSGESGFYCTAGTGYDYMTGLGSPATTAF